MGSQTDRAVEGVSVMSTRSRIYAIPGAARPPWLGRLDQLATPRPVTTPVAPQRCWKHPRVASESLIRGPQALVFGTLGALGGSTRPVVVVLDEAASVEPIDLSSVTDLATGVVIDPLTFGPLPSSSFPERSGEW
jgi:hypothetical protein